MIFNNLCTYIRIIVLYMDNVNNLVFHTLFINDMQPALFMQPGMLQTMEYDSMKVILMCLPNAKGDMLNINVSIVGSCSLDGYLFLVG